MTNQSRLRVPRFLASEDIEVHVIDGFDCNGSENVVGVVNTTCRLEGCSSVVFSKDGSQHVISKRAYIFKVEGFGQFDDVVSGFCILRGVRFECPRIFIMRNPDGTVNHIKVEMK